MKILLVEPPFLRLYNEHFSMNKLPLSLGYLASSIKSNTSHDVLIYNAEFYHYGKPSTVSYLAHEGYKNYIHNLSDLHYSVWQEVSRTIAEYDPDIVGITSKSQNFASACITAQMVKELKPTTTVIVGGPHPSLVGKEVLQECSYMDIAVKGEGELTLIDLLNAISNAKPLKEIPGIIFRNGDDIIENANQPLIADLDKLESPYKYASTLLKSYTQYPKESFRSIFAIRGCPYDCTFCGSGKIWQRKVRFRSAKNVADEILLLQKIGVNYFNFDDDTFGVTKKYIHELCSEIIKKCQNIKWSCELHVKLIDDDNLAIMKKAGCDLIKIGIESGNNEVLKEIGKLITIGEALTAARLIRRHNMHVMAFFMVGFPQETEKTLHDTFAAIKKLPGYVTYSIFTPYKGTKAYDICFANGNIPENFNVSIYNHTSPVNCFCSNIPHDRFRQIVSKIEKYVDRKNYTYEQKVKFYKYSPINIYRKIFLKKNN